MSNLPKSETSNTVVKAVEDASQARRRMIRAGLAAGPVMMGLKTQSAMATGTVNHCKPSVWSSLKAANGCHSSHTIQSAGKTCSHYDYWSTSTNTECDKKYHTHATLPCVPFGGTTCQDATVKDVCRGYKIVTGGYFNGSHNWVSTQSQVSCSTGNAELDKFAKHCGAMYLNNTVNNSCSVDVPTVKSMWNACKDGGTWTPATGGTPWSRKDCNDYFDYVCSGTQPAGWNNSCT